MTKIILLKDVIHLGQSGDIKDVKDGYLRNFLLPQKLAVMATKDKIRSMEEARARKEAERGENAEKVKEDLVKLSETRIIIKSKVNEKGHLFDGVGKDEIEEKIADLGIEHINKEWILLDKPIKEMGEFDIAIKTPSGIEGRVKITITEEKTKVKKTRKK